MTTYWHIGDGEVSLCKNVLVWDLLEGNHASDHAEASPLYGVLFGFLDTVTWTARTGGVIWGNNEYNQEDRGFLGAGGEYKVVEYGV